MAAERDTIDRYLAAYLADRVGNEFSARISGVARFGAFARLDETGADGLIPIRSIGAEFFHYDADTQSLRGSDTGFTLSMGQRVVVRLAEAVPITGGIGLELLSVEDEAVPVGRRQGKSRPVRRKIAAKRAKSAKLKKKAKRKRV
jgi:ribonuclease R